jgi:hypothetical protein
MYYMIYRSVATDSPNEASLLKMLEWAREANAKRGVTGMLLYQNGRYMQMLEGEEATVRELFDKISRDPRHHLVKIVASGTTAKRHFNDWSMGFRDMDQVSNLPDYDTYLNQQLAENRFGSEERVAYQFMLHFIESA